MILLSYFFLDRFGRRSSLIAAFGLLISTSILAVLLDHWSLFDISLWINFCSLGTSIGLLGIFFTFVPEIFPTTVRVNGLGFVSVIGRSGGIVAPFILHSSKSGGPWYIAYLIFAIFGVLALLSALFLPETAKYSLPQNVAEASKASQNSDRNLAIKSLIMGTMFVGEMNNKTQSNSNLNIIKETIEKKNPIRYLVSKLVKPVTAT